MFVTKVKKTIDLDSYLFLFTQYYLNCPFIAIESKFVTYFRAMKAKLPPAAEWAAPLMTKASLEWTATKQKGNRRAMLNWQRQPW